MASEVKENKEKKPKKEKKPEGEAKKEAPTVFKYEAGYVPRLQKYYQGTVRAALVKRFGYDNAMRVPRLEKIVVNMGLGAAVANPKIIDAAKEDLRLLTGQQPITRRSRKSIANFKLRAGLPIGLTVTLRKNKMWEFADRLLSLALPRVRDFKGINPKGFDGAGNFTMGLKEQIIFPEIDYDKVDAIRGMNVSFVTTAKTNEEGRELLKQIGMPFRS